MPLIPPEISLDVLRTSPDFDAADAKTREIGFGGGFIPPWIIQGAIEHAEHGASAEIIERNRTDFTMRM